MDSNGLANKRAVVLGILFLVTCALMYTFFSSTTAAASSSSASSASSSTSAAESARIFAASSLQLQRQSDRNMRQALAQLSNTAKSSQAVHISVASKMDSLVEKVDALKGAVEGQPALDKPFPLVNDCAYVRSFRQNLCEVKNENGTTTTETNNIKKRNQHQQRRQRGISSQIPSCPAHFEHKLGDEHELHPDQRSKYVAEVYQNYSKNCDAKKGLMWGGLHVGDVADRWMERMMDLVFHGKPGKGDDDARKPTSLKWLDWASGCGANLHYYSRHYQNYVAEGAEFHGVGVDLTDAAVDWARRHARSLYPGWDMGEDSSRVPSPFLRNTTQAGEEVSGGSTVNSNTVRFCHADGTKLDWLPQDSFDVITSLAGLYHLPRKFICSTMRHLITLLKPKTGRLVTCYVHPESTTQSLLNCQYDCSGGDQVKVTLINQNPFLEVPPSVGMPLGYTYINASCMLWERL